MSTTTNPHQAPPFDCPNCATQLPGGSPDCHACGIRLTGPFALRLWHVGREIDALVRERDALRARLLAPPDVEEQQLTGVPLHPGAPVPAAGRPAAPRSRGWSAQQVLLGIGALLLLSGAAFFIAVVWALIGVLGQSLVMVTLTGLAAAGAVLATHRRLPAAAETSAVIATGLVLLDLSAAHGLGLFGLDRWDSAVYWSGAGFVGAAVLAGFEAWLPRTVDGAPARRVFVYRPAITVLVCVSWWNLLAFAPDVDGGTAAAGLALVLALLSVGVAVAAHLLDRPQPGRFRPSVVAPVVSAAVAFLVYLALAVAAGWSPGTAAERYGAMALLLVMPALAVALSLRGPLAARTDVRKSLSLLAAVGLFLAAGVPAVEAPREALAVLAVVMGVAAGLLLARPLEAMGPRSVAAGWLLTGIFAALSLVWWLEGEDARSGLELFSGAPGGPPAAVWVAALPPFAFAIAAGSAAVARRSVEWSTVAQVGAYVGLAALLRNSADTLVLVVTLLLALMHVGAAALARTAGRSREAFGFEVLAALGAALLASAAAVVSWSQEPWVEATTWLLLGAAALAYAVLPGRLWVGYLGAFLVPMGVGVLLEHAGVEVVEAYTVTAVVLLAALGVVQERRTASVATLVSMGPALVVGVVPSLWVGIAGDELLRLVLVTLVGLALVVVGFVQRWRAPVVVGVFTLGAVAWTQGGPLVQYVPNFVLLMGAGLAALVIGVAWEAAVKAGRRGIVWFSGLR